MKPERILRFLNHLKRILWYSLLALVVVLTQTKAEIQLSKPIDQIRPYTIGEQFDFISWTLGAFWDKFSAASMNWQDILPQENYKSIVFSYLQNQQELNQHEQWINTYYADPTGSISEEQFTQIHAEYLTLKENQKILEPVYESLLTEQIRTVLHENGLTVGSQVFPPVLFRDADLPYALILSPRDHIEQIVNLSLLPELSLEEMIALENRIESELDVSALVVPVGGIGTYPTMIMRTTNFTYTAEVIQHEWTHNFLTLRPLGLNYETTPELRTINETTASISGKELGNDLLAAYYPEFLPQPVQEPVQEEDAAAEESEQIEEQPVIEEPVFDYRAEMHETRVHVDELLAAGKIEQAESYMEERRLFFWENGYQIRKLNQAYYAFYGAYADQPGGAAGNDPVGEAVRNYRAQSGSLNDFLRSIAWVTSFDELQSMLQPN
jgi:hypothetical protein